jgi:hypothetical protein
MIAPSGSVVQVDEELVTRLREQGFTAQEKPKPARSAKASK